MYNLPILFCIYLWTDLHVDWSVSSQGIHKGEYPHQYFIWEYRYVCTVTHSYNNDKTQCYVTLTVMKNQRYVIDLLL